MANPDVNVTVVKCKHNSFFKAENTVNFFQKKEREENIVDEFVGPDLRVGRGPPIPLDVLVLAHERDNCLDAT